MQRPLLFPKRPSTTTIKHLLCAAVKRQRSTWQRYRDDLELHRSEHNLPIARGHWRTTPWCLRGFPGTSALGLVETGIELIRRSHSALWLTRLRMAITVSFRNKFSKNALTLQCFYIHGSASQCGWLSDVIFSSVRGLIALWSRSAVAQSKAASNHTKKAIGCHLKFLSYRCSNGGHSELLVDFFQGLSLRTLCVWTTMEGVDLGRDSDRMGSGEEVLVWRV